MSACKSCGAQIRWVHTPGKRMMPLNEKPDPKGLIIIFGGVAFFEKDFKGDASKMDHFTSHFATCPNASEHRKKA